MKTKVRLNCYFFSNVIVGLLSLNMIFNNETPKLIATNDDKGKLEAIYTFVEKVEEQVEDEKVEETATISVTKKTLTSSKIIPYVRPSYNSVTGANLVNYAKHYLGLRYVSAGNSLSTGTDCSGFTRLIFREFGINLGRTVLSQLYSGSYVSKSDLQPGDLVFYGYSSSASHVAIYIGSGRIIHESNPRDGVKISSVNIMRYITARRLITAKVVKKPEEKVEKKIEEKTEEKVQDKLEEENQEKAQEKKPENLDEKKQEQALEKTEEKVQTELEDEKKTEESLTPNDDKENTDAQVKDENVKDNVDNNSDTNNKVEENLSDNETGEIIPDEKENKESLKEVPKDNSSKEEEPISSDTTKPSINDNKDSSESQEKKTNNTMDSNINNIEEEPLETRK